MKRNALEQIKAVLMWVTDDLLQLMIDDLEQFGQDVTMLQACRELLEERRKEKPEQRGVIEL